MKLEALGDFTDRNGIERKTGEQWLHTEEGAFIPDVQEKIISKIRSYILTDRKALHVEAMCTFLDGFSIFFFLKMKKDGFGNGFFSQTQEM